GNAIRFTNKGYVKLKVSLSDQKDNGVKLRCAVDDTGIGIQEERRNKIIEDYWKGEDDTWSTYGGAGLGLGNVRKRGEIQDGEIDFTSEYGKGTTFWFIINFKSL